MRWSFKIGRFAGIDLYVHATFFLLILWVVILHWLEGRTVQAVVSGLVFILVLFACVVLHEFGHALTARRYGLSHQGHRTATDWRRIAVRAHA
jgi:Zn-dependent protease